MSSIKYELEAEVRKDLGRGASRRLRQIDRLPAVVYGAGEKPVSLLLDHKKASLALAHEGFYSRILTLKINNKSEKVILKALQRHPVKPRYLHIDFLRVRADQKLTMHVPLHFIGESDAPGLKEGGAFAHHVSDVEVSCLPAALPEFIEVDVSNMALNDSIHLSHLHLPKGVELTAFAHGVEGHDSAIVSLAVPRVIEEEVEAPPAEAAPGDVPATEQTAAPEGTDENSKKE